MIFQVRKYLFYHKNITSTIHLVVTENYFYLYLPGKKHPYLLFAKTNFSFHLKLDLNTKAKQTI